MAMKKSFSSKITLLALGALLLFSLVPAVPVHADPYPLHFPPAPTLSVQSPKNGTTYPELVPIEFTIITHPAPIGGESKITDRSLQYTIDGLNVVPLNFNLTVTANNEDSEREWLVDLTYHYSFTVYNIVPLKTAQEPMGAGNHTFSINVYSELETGATSPSVSASVQFAVDSAPTITVFSPEEKTYNTTDVPLTFTTSEPVTSTTYTLDSRENVTTNDNLTLSGLSQGVHNLTVYAKDAIGNIGASKTILFNVTIPQSPQTGFLGSTLPTEYGLMIIGALVVVAVTTGFFVHKRQRNGAKAA
jgi:hypothetical protein